MRSRSPPALCAAASSAPSVGSPTIFHVPVFLRRDARCCSRGGWSRVRATAAVCGASALPALEAHFAIRPVAFAGDFVALARDVQFAHRHLADGERAGLVGADDVGRAERFDGGQLAHERAAAGHAQNAERERDGDDGGQPLRHGGDGEAHRGHEQLKEFSPAQQPQPEEQRDDAQRGPDEDAPERVQLLLQRRALVRARLLRSVRRCGPTPSSSPWRRRRRCPVPAATLVPMNSMFSRSPSGDLARSSVVGALFTASDSPVSADSMHLQRGRFEQPCIRRDQVACFQRRECRRPRFPRQERQ